MKPSAEVSPIPTSLDVHPLPFTGQAAKDLAKIDAAIEAVKKKIPKAKRQAIFIEIVKVEGAADAEAKRQIPDPPDNVVQIGDVYERQETLKDHLEDRARAKLARHIGITEDQLQFISLEGVTDHWPDH